MSKFYLRHRMVEDPGFARKLFNDTRFSFIWVPVRLFLAMMWLAGGLHKLFEYKAVKGDLFGFQGIEWGVMNKSWMLSSTAIKGYWDNAVKLTDGKGSITFDWYRSFLQFLIDTKSYEWFSKVIVFGEIAVGLGLLVGALVGIAAFFGASMNMAFLLAGTTSSNPVLLILSIIIVLAWKTAGYWGLDRFLLPMLGTPWKAIEEEPVTDATGTPVLRPGAVQFR